MNSAISQLHKNPSLLGVLRYTIKFECNVNLPDEVRCLNRCQVLKVEKE